MRQANTKPTIKKILFSFAFLAFIIFYCFSCCRDNGLKNYLDQIYLAKKSNTFKVDLVDLYNNQKGIIYIFYPETSQLEISNALGMQYDNYTKIRDDQRRIIIVGSGEILFEDEFLHDQIYFSEGEFIEKINGKILSNPYMVFRSSKFEVIRRQKQDYYVLIGK